MLPYTNTVPYCLLLAALGSVIASIIMSSTDALVVQKMSNKWFREVCPSGYLFFSSDFKGGVRIGYDGLNLSHLVHHDHPRVPLPHDLNLGVAPRNW